MRAPTARGAFDRERTAIAGDHAERMREDAIEVLLAHREADHADVATIPVQHGDCELIRICC